MKRAFYNALPIILVATLLCFAQGVTVTTTGVQTLTHKTLTSPVVNGSPTGTGLPTWTQKTGSGSPDYTTTSPNLTNIDGTNLSYTATIPSGWKLAVWFTCWGNNTAGTAAIALADGGTTLRQSLSGVTTTNLPYAVEALITGDGASHTITPQFSSSAGTFTVSNSVAASRAPVMITALMPSN